METIELRPLGMVRNGVTETIRESWEDVISEIVVRDDLAGVLDGLEGFSHVLVIFWMHQARPADGVRARPRGRPDMPRVGLLAIRTPHRPNPIGLTAAEVMGTATRKLKVRGLDAIDGTPILDIKPYMPGLDRRDGVRVPEWVDLL